MEREATHQRSKYLNYKKLNKSFANKKTPKEDTVILDDTLDRDSSSSSEDYNFPDEYLKTSITYDPDYADDDKNSKSSICRRETNGLNGCRYAFIIHKLKNNGKSKIKEHTLSSNNLDESLHDAHLLNTLLNPTNKDKQNKSNNKLKHIHISLIIFVKLVIPAGKKDRQSNTRLVKALL